MTIPLDRDKNKDSLIHILTWFLFLVGVFSLCARLGSKLFLYVRIGWDDWLVLAAQIVLLFQCITLSYGAANGLGRPIDILSPERVDTTLQVEYAYVPLFLLALALIKWSLSIFVHKLSPNSIHHRINMTMAVIVGLWLVTSEAVWLFQCSPPATWDFLGNETCVNRRAAWIYISVFNISTECAFVGLYVLIFYSLQMTWSNKAKVLGIFATRLLVVVTAAVQIVVFIESLPAPTGSRYNGWMSVICNQVVICISVVTACLPYLKPFMQSIELGVVQVDDTGSQEGLSQRQTNAGTDSAVSSGRGRTKKPRRSARNDSDGLFSQLSRVAHPATVYQTPSLERETIEMDAVSAAASPPNKAEYNRII